MCSWGSWHWSWLLNLQVRHASHKFRRYSVKYFPQIDHLTVGINWLYTWYWPYVISIINLFKVNYFSISGMIVYVYLSYEPFGSLVINLRYISNNMLSIIDMIMFIDNDECERHNGGCSQLCVNVQGGYYCKCRYGYHLHSDDRTCIRKFWSWYWFIHAALSLNLNFAFQLQTIASSITVDVLTSANHKETEDSSAVATSDTCWIQTEGTAIVSDRWHRFEAACKTRFWVCKLRSWLVNSLARLCLTNCLRLYSQIVFATCCSMTAVCCQHAGRFQKLWDSLNPSVQIFRICWTL